jgi:hypothetical protein
MVTIVFQMVNNQGFFGIQRNSQKHTETHYRITFVNNQLEANSFSCMLISILYMFQAAMCASSGELIVSHIKFHYRIFQETIIPVNKLSVL